MRTRRFGPHGVDVPVVGIGTWNMERDDRTHAIAALRRALDLGMTHVDTAEMYGNGRVETLVGEAIAGRRDELFLVSKVLPNNAAFDVAQRACEASLRRLGTDRLDLLLLHWPGDIPLAETFRAFEALRAAGKIRAWGVSNFDDRDLDEALAIVGEGVIACNQVLYHLGDRTIEHRVIPWCEAHHVEVVAYSPFGSRGGPALAPKLDAVARRLRATPRQVALAFLAQRSFVIPKSSQAAHVEELAEAGELELDEPAIAEIDAAFPRGPWQGLPMI
ncbi:MAG: aldo/keto reductase [Deltaproteobacteria bacterium]|nr:aldo/keto reductase [Deltaproteobacteria bacterium]